MERAFWSNCPDGDEVDVTVRRLVVGMEAVVQWNRMRSEGLGIPERMGSNPDYGMTGDWASTRGNGSQVGGLSDRRFPLGGLL